MRIIIFIFTIIAGIPLVNLAQIIPNGNFEIWSENNSGMPQPQYWETQNEPELIYVEAVSGFSGNHAASLNVQWDNMLKEYCGASLNTEFTLVEYKKYHTLSGYFKGNSENNDTLVIEINLFCGNKPIGKGATKILDHSNRWQAFNIQIQYYSDSKPDKASISIEIKTLNGSHSLSTYCIDELLLANLEFLEDKNVTYSKSI